MGSNPGYLLKSFLLYPFFTTWLIFKMTGCGLLIKISLHLWNVGTVRRKCKTGISHPRIYLTIHYNGTEALMKLHWNSLAIKTHQIWVWVWIRCLMGSTNQADPSCFYFRISWILMEWLWFHFFHPLHLVQGLRSNNIK